MLNQSDYTSNRYTCTECEWASGNRPQDSQVEAKVNHAIDYDHYVRDNA